MNIIDQASDMLKGRRIRSHFWDDFGNHCLMGALNAVAGAKPWGSLSQHPELSRAVRIIAGVIEEQYPDQFWDLDEDDRIKIANFNNHASTTDDDVERVLQKSSALFDESTP